MRLCAILGERMLFQDLPRKGLLSIRFTSFHMTALSILPSVRYISKSNFPWVDEKFGWTNIRWTTKKVFNGINVVDEKKCIAEVYEPANHSFILGRTMYDALKINEPVSCESCFSGICFPTFRQISFTRYPRGGFMKTHVDSIKDVGHRGVEVCIISRDFQGGDLLIYPLNSVEGPLPEFLVNMENYQQVSERSRTHILRIGDISREEICCVFIPLGWKHQVTPVLSETPRIVLTHQVYENNEIEGLFASRLDVSCAVLECNRPSKIREYMSRFIATTLKGTTGVERRDKFIEMVRTNTSLDFRPYGEYIVTPLEGDPISLREVMSVIDPPKYSPFLDNGDGISWEELVRSSARFVTIPFSHLSTDDMKECLRILSTTRREVFISCIDIKYKVEMSRCLCDVTSECYAHNGPVDYHWIGNPVISMPELEYKYVSKCNATLFSSEFNDSNSDINIYVISQMPVLVGYLRNGVIRTEIVDSSF